MVRTFCSTQGVPIPLDQEDVKLIEGVSLNSLQPSTRVSYGAGLLAFHIFCNSKKIDEDLRAPVNLAILQSFVARMAGIYSVSTISGYMAAIQAWHIIHGIVWAVDGPELGAIVKGAQKMAPKKSERQKQELATIKYIKKIIQHLLKTNNLDITVWACLTTAFWGAARLGEVTVPNLSAFDPKIHVKSPTWGRVSTIKV